MPSGPLHCEAQEWSPVPISTYPIRVRGILFLQMVSVSFASIRCTQLEWFPQNASSKSTLSLSVLRIIWHMLFEAGNLRNLTKIMCGQKTDEGLLRDPVWQTRNVVNIDGLTTSTETASTELDSVDMLCFMKLSMSSLIAQSNRQQSAIYDSDVTHDFMNVFSSSFSRILFPYMYS